MKSSRAFTLIELLIVIAIIGILMSLLFPAVNAAIDSARKAQAKNDVTQIATAVTAYETEYGKLPDNVSTVTLAFTKILTGEDTSANPRKIVFLEVNAAKKGKSGTNTSAFVDPWGGTYKIAFDNEGGTNSYDNSITAGASGSYGSDVALRKKVGVWSDPNSHTNGSTAQKKRRYVTSWD